MCFILQSIEKEGGPQTIAGTDPGGVDGVASHPPWMAMQLLRHAKHYITEIIYGLGHL